MKNQLPHIIYASLILGLTLFFWQAVRRVEDRIAFMNKPAREIFDLLVAGNKTTKTQIEKSCKTYPNPANDQIWQYCRQADSLTSLALNHQLSPDSLRAHLIRFTDREPQIAADLKSILPTQNKPGNSMYADMRLCQDSLRPQIALAMAMEYFGAKTSFGGTGCGGPPTLMASFTSLFPSAGMPFQMDMVLADYAAISTNSIRINGKELKIQDGVGFYDHTFSLPGIYPLQVEIDNSNPLQDSIFTAKKTFYLHVKP